MKHKCYWIGGIIILTIIFINGCDDNKLSPLIDENGSIMDKGPFARMNPCEGLCEEKGMAFSSCGEGPLDARLCDLKEIDVGASDLCVDENGEGSSEVCCCKEVHEFTKFQIIRVYPNQKTINEELKEIPLGEIFVNHEAGKVVVSTTAEEELLSALMKGIDAAKSTNLTLESEGIKVIDGGEALVMRSKVIGPTDDEYALALRYFLSFDYDWESDLFDFDLVEVDKWTAYKDGKKVLEFENIKDGFLISSVGLSEPAIHPFLNAKFLDEEEESVLGDIIDESTGFLDFIARLVEAGYLVKAEDGESLLK